MASTPSTPTVAPFALVIPTLNAGAFTEPFLQGLARQTVQPTNFVVMDSESTDGTPDRMRAAGAKVVTVRRAEFNHGGTRMRGLDHVGSEAIVVYMTQDALFADDRVLERLVAAFDDPTIAVTYGRQLPHEGAAGIESFARIFNYPATNQLRSIADVGRYGFKVCFCSNSLAAYRIDALKAIGGFPTDTIFGEDTLATARLLLSGSKIFYNAEAAVRHSHSYGLMQEFRRYFDIGVMHTRSADLMAQFGSVESEGRRFVVAELSYLLANDPLRIPSAVVRTGLKYLGYKLGRAEARLPLDMKRRLSMHRGFWRNAVAQH